MSLPIFQLSDLSEHRTSCNVGTMFVRCLYNVHTMFVQCSYNGKKKFVQCSYNASLKFVQYCTNASAIVRTLCELCVRSILQINVRWYIKKCQQTSPSILCTLDNEIVPFVLTLLWPAARARLSMRDLTCMLYTVPRTQSYQWVYQAMQVRPWQPGSFDIIWQGKPVTTYCRAKARFHRFP